MVLGEEKMNIGSRIANLRKTKNLSQQELANQLFVCDKTISSWEKNRTEPSLELISKMSEIFSCAISYLMYGDAVRNDIETEIKIKLLEKDWKNLNLFFQKEAKFMNENKQIDTYFQPTYRNFVNEEKIKSQEKISEWLRIGKRGNTLILNYKKWYDNYCDEYEVEIDNDKNLQKIFTVLEIEKLVVVEKTRKTYFYLDKYEVALDSVKDLGYFIEIEVKKYDKKPMQEYDALLRVAKDLNLNLDCIDKRGYPYYLIENKYKKD